MTTMTTAVSTGATLDPPTQKFVDALAAAGGPPLYTLSPADARKVLDDAQAIEIVKLPADITERNIPGGPTGDVSVRVVRPQGVTETLPAIIYIHGGGWILGNAGTHDRLVREIANGARAAVIFVNYTPSPEAHFPVAIEQEYTVAKYVAEHADEFNIDPSRVAVVGDSVGGNMAAAVTILAKERGGPRFCFQALFYPVTNAAFDTASYNTFANGPWLTRRAMEWFWDAYAPDVSDRLKPTASPLRASLEQLRDLPPALIIVDENDVLRDEGEAYAHKLMEAGVDVAALRVLGTIHDFMMLNGIANTPAVREAIAVACEKLRMVFTG